MRRAPTLSQLSVDGGSASNTMLSPDEVASNWQESRKLLQKVKSVIEKMHAAVASSGMSTASLGQNTTQCLKVCCLLLSLVC